ncbi:MAG: copper resistance protein CopC [Pseudomonadota bacterium]|nr:copper resistance protein CopC [Pseudomonadota bacterium]
MVMLNSWLVRLTKLTTGLILLTVFNPAHADVKLLDSFPQQGAELSKSVTDVRLWFDQEPLAERSRVVLVRNGEEIPVIALHSMGERDLMGLVQRATPPGRYELIWQVAAETDGQIQSGRLEFEIKATTEP